MTKTLADQLTARPRFARSANLERDAASLEPLDGYLLTSRALDVIDRLATAAAIGPSGGAWSVTGPYGSGKSSLGLLIDALFGPHDDGVYSRAIDLLNETSPGTAER